MHVVDESGNPIVGASVVATNTDSWTDVSYSGTTDERGIFFAPRIRAGTVGDRYTIRAQLSSGRTPLKSGKILTQVNGWGLVDLVVRVAVSESGARDVVLVPPEAKPERIHCLEVLKVLIKKVIDGRSEPQWTVAYANSRNVSDGVRDVYSEAVEAFVSDLPLASVVMSAIALELAIRERFEAGGGRGGEMEFHQLIDWAKKEGLLDKNDKQIADLVRVFYNIHKHDYRSAAKQDPQLAISLTLRLLNRLSEGRSVSSTES